MVNRANVRYADLLAENKAREFAEYEHAMNRLTRKEWAWVLSLVSGLLLSLVWLVWWLS